MSVTIRAYNNNTQLAAVTIPDGAVTRIQALYPAATAADSAAAFLADLWPLGRELLRKKGANAVSATQEAANVAAHSAYEASFNTDVPT